MVFSIYIVLLENLSYVYFLFELLQVFIFF